MYFSRLFNRMQTNRGQREEVEGTRRAKCIALDLDGTTLNSSGELSIRTEAALLKAASQGIEIIVASGRSLASLPVCIRRFLESGMP